VSVWVPAECLGVRGVCESQVSVWVLGEYLRVRWLSGCQAGYRLRVGCVGGTGCHNNVCSNLYEFQNLLFSFHAWVV